MVDVLIVHEEDYFFGLQNLLAKSCAFADHGDQEAVEALVHQAFDMAQLLVTFFLDIELHFVSD